MTFRALPNSVVSCSFSRRSRAISLSLLSAGGRPAGRANASFTAWSRCFFHAAINDVYRPSRRSSDPLPALSNDSYSSRILALYAAEYCRDRAFAGTSGSGTRSIELIVRDGSQLALRGQYFRLRPCLIRAWHGGVRLDPAGEVVVDRAQR